MPSLRPSLPQFPPTIGSPTIQHRQKQQCSWQFCPRGGKPVTPTACKTCHQLRQPSRKTCPRVPTPRRRGPPGKYVRNGRKRTSEEFSTAITRPRRSDESLAAKTSGMVFFCPTYIFCTRSLFTRVSSTIWPRRSGFTLFSPPPPCMTSGVKGTKWISYMWTGPPVRVRQSRICWNEKKLMDLLIIGDLNNILDDDEDRFIARLDDFYNAVVAQGEKNERGNRNTFEVATLF